jgi:hypothetical protein
VYTTGQRTREQLYPDDKETSFRAEPGAAVVRSRVLLCWVCHQGAAMLRMLSEVGIINISLV